MLIDGRMKTDKVTTSKARNTIRSHYRWVRHDTNNSEVDKDENFADRRRDVYLKWKHGWRKKLRQIAVMSTSDLTVAQNNILADYLHEDSSHQPTTSMMYDEEMGTMSLDNAINANEPISAQSSTEEFSNSSIPPPPPLQEPQPQVLQSFSDESSLTDDSPTCVTADVSHYQRSANEDFVRIQNISKKGIIQKIDRNKGRVT